MNFLIKKIKNYLKSKDFLQHLVLAILPSILLLVLFYANNLHLVHWDNSTFRFFRLASLLFFLWIILVQKIFFLKYLPLGFSFTFIFLVLVPDINYKNILIYILTFTFAIGLYFAKKYLKIIYVFISFIIISQIFQGFLKYEKQNKTENFDLSIKKYNQPLKKKYSVYYLLIDSYSSQKTLLNQDKLDNSPFINWLDSKGFSTNNNAFSNYGRTYTSMQAIFEMKHNYYRNMNLHTLETPTSRYVMAGANPVIGRFFNNGFSVYINPFASQGFFEDPNKEKFTTEWKGIIDKKINLDSLRSDLYWLLKYIDSIKDTGLTGKRYTPEKLEVIENLQNSKISTDKNLLFLRNLKNISYEHKNFVYLHYNLELDYDCTKSSIREDYIYKIKCTNYDLMKSINYILNKDQNSIIIVHSDHGAWTRRTKGNDMQKRFGILFSVRWPKECAYLGKEKYTPVNLFPRVFACLNGEKPDYENMAADDSYLIGAWSDDKNKEPNKVFKVIENNEILSEFQ